MTLVAVAEAQRLAIEHATPRTTELVPLRDGAMRRSAKHIHARFDLPGADVSIMDGWACTLATLRSGRAKVIGESKAGLPFAGAVADGAAVRISTGAVIPMGAELVVLQEDTSRDGDALAFAEAELADARAGQHIRAKGSDVRAGTPLVRPGDELHAARLALIGATGASLVEVHRRPRVAILCTGDELVAIGDEPPPGGVIGTNDLMLAIMCAEAGANVVETATVGDDPALLDTALERVMDLADVVITSGGASVGDHDHVRDSAKRRDIVYWGVALRPGKPTGLVRVRDSLWFALPGNPASAFVTFELFVRPALRKMAGVLDDPRRPSREMVVGADFDGDRTREHWARASIIGDRVHPVDDQRSGSLGSLAAADALARIEPGRLHVRAGERVAVMMLGSGEP